MTRIITILLFVVAIGLGYFLTTSIKTDIDEEDKIRITEQRIINKLKIIREAQTTYQTVHGHYTDSWDSLINFINNGQIPIVEKREQIFMLAYGADSTVVEYDTLGMVSVRDSVFNEREYPNLNVENLPYIPGSDGQKFDLYAGTIKKGTGATVNVFEVKDTYVINPARRKESGLGPLRIGSRTEATTQGNWEF